MQQRRLGNSGLKISEIGLGGNTFGATVDGDEAVATIRQALDLGITFVDTADMYAGTKSEVLVGKALEGRRQDVVLATKLGMAVPTPGGGGLSRRWIMRAVEDSLKRLNTDYIDLYQCHQPDPETPLEETLRAMDDLVTQGKVRYIGGSNHKAWQMADAAWISEHHGLSRWISAQNQFNVLDGLDDPSLLEAADRFGFGIIPHRPLASGALTGKYRVGEEPPADSRAAANPRQRDSLMRSERLTRVAKLGEWAAERGHTTAQLAVAWLLAHPQVSTVIIGARSTDQVLENARSGGWTLTAEERAEVAKIGQE